MLNEGGFCCPFEGPSVGSSREDLRRRKERKKCCQAGEMLHVAEALIDKSYHPTVISRAYNKALEDALAVLEKIAVSIDVNDQPSSVFQSLVSDRACPQLCKSFKSKTEPTFSSYEVEMV